MNTVAQKTCTKCRQEKARTDFYRSSRTKDGLYPWCKQCKIAVTRQYNIAHPDTVHKSQQAYRQAHRENLLPKVRERSATWRTQNRGKDRAASLRWAKNNPDAYRTIQQNRRARVRGATGNYTTQEWRELKARYDYRCLCCGRQEPEISLTVDHVVALASGGTNDIANIQPLCLSCNCSKQDRTIDYR